MVRALVGARVSHVQGAEKTSHIVQHKTGSAYAEAQGWTVVGTFEDLDVSALTTSPWERPDLGPWLTDRADEWDALIVAKTDRLFRSAKDSVDVAHWAEKNRKILVFVDDGLRLDFYHPSKEQDGWSDMMTRMFLLMSALFAEMEGRRFVARARDRTKFLRTTDRWSHGSTPYGYRTADHAGGKGKALVHDAAEAAVLRDLAAWILNDGVSLTGAAARLNTESVPSPRARHWRPGNRKSREGPPAWSVGMVKRVLTSPATQGMKATAEGRPVLDAKGAPIRVGPATFESDVWTQLQAAVAERISSGRKRRHSLNPMLGVGVCALCGRSLAQRTRQTSTKTYRYYRCSRTPKECPRVTIRAEVADARVESEFLSTCGDLSIRRRVWQAGEDVSYELDEVRRTIEGLREDRALGLFSTEEDQATYRAQMAALVARRDALAAVPVRRSGWVYEFAPRTYREAWAEADVAERRRMLVDADVKLVLSDDGTVDIQVPLDMRYRARRSGSAQ